MATDAPLTDFEADTVGLLLAVGELLVVELELGTHAARKLVSLFGVQPIGLTPDWFATNAPGAHPVPV